MQIFKTLNTVMINSLKTGLSYLRMIDKHYTCDGHELRVGVENKPH